MTVTTPDFLPTLSSGGHSADSGQACVMEYVSLLAGEEWSDSPTCTHPVLAGFARFVNDSLQDKNRHHLVPLIGRLFGTAETGDWRERIHFSLELGAWAMEYFGKPVGTLGFKTSADRLRYLLRFSKWGGPGLMMATPEVLAGLIARYVYQECMVDQFAPRMETVKVPKPYNMVAPLKANEGSPPAELEMNYYVQHRMVDNTENELKLVKFLSDLIDEYDRLAGRTEHRELTTDDLKALADELVSA